MNEIVDKWCKIAENLTTYLSDSVKELVLEKGIAADVDQKLTATTSDLLDITNLSSILLNDGISTFLFCCRALQPMSLI